jgi:hypothetical protein
LGQHPVRRAQLPHETNHVEHAPLIRNLMIFNAINHHAVDHNPAERGSLPGQGAIMQTPHLVADHHPVILGDHVLDMKGKITEGHPEQANGGDQAVTSIRQTVVKGEMIDKVFGNQLLDQAELTPIPAFLNVSPYHSGRINALHLNSCSCQCAPPPIGTSYQS